MCLGFGVSYLHSLEVWGLDSMYSLPQQYSFILLCVVSAFTFVRLDLSIIVHYMFGVSTNSVFYGLVRVFTVYYSPL